MNIILKAKTFIFKQKIYSSISFKILFFLFFLQMGIALKGIAQTTYTSIAGAGNWNQTTTWVGGVVPVTNPSAGNKVIINGTVTITTPLGFQDLDITVNKSLTVGAGGDITISRLITISNLGALVINSGRTLTVDYEGRIINNGTININGTITRGTNFEPLNTFPIWGYAPGPWPLNNNTTGIVNINNGGTLQWTNAPTSLGFDANINNAGTINVSGTLNNANVAANKLINNGVLQLNQGGTLAATPTYGGSSTLIYNQTANVNVGNEWTGNSTTVGVGVPQNIIVQINAATLTMPAARGLAGNLTISSGTLALAATLTNKANTITNNAILQLNQGGIIGTAPVIYGNASTLIYNQTAVTTIGNEWSANSTVTTAGSGIPQDVIIQLNAKATTITIPTAVNKSIGGNLNINTGTFILAGTSNFYLGGDWINNSAFSAGGGSSVNFQGTNDNILAGSSSTTFNDLVVNKSVGKKVTSNSLAFSTARNVIVTQGNLILQAIDANYVVNNDILVATNGVLTHSVPWDSPPLKLDKLLLVSGNISIDGVFNYTVRSHVQMNGIGKTVYTGNKAGSAFSIFTLTSPGNISAAGTVNINDNFWPMFGTAGSFSTGTNTVNANASVLMNNGSVNINGGTFNVIGGISIGFSGNPAIVNLSAGTLNADLVNVGNGPVKGTFNHSGGVANIGNLIITNTTPTSAYICTGSPVINMTGNWTNNGIFTAASSQVNFLGTTLQSISGATTFYNLAKSNNSTLMLNSNVTVSNNLVFNSVNDLLDINGQTLTIAKTLSSINQFKGSFASNMTIGAGSPALNFITGSQNLNNLILSGVSSLGTPLTINNNLNLNTSLFTIGNNDLSFIPSATITGSTGPTNMIIATGPGKVVKQFSGVGSFTYPIGDATGTTEYSPATISFTSGTFGPNANVGVNVVNDKQPYNTSASDFVNRYWNVSTNNITNYSANPVFTYVSADMVGVLANIKTAGFGVDSVWSIGNPATATTLSVTGETNLNKSYTGVNFTAANVYFRSITNGLWSNGANWQSSISGNSFWSTTLIVPNSTSLGILIKGGDTVSVNSSISLGRTLVNGDLKLVTGGIMTLANAPDALTVNTGAIFNVTTTGNYTTTFLTSPNSNITVNTGGKILVGDGVTATGADFEYLADITHKSVWRTGAIFEWNINRVPRTLTFFPTASSDIPIFRISKTSNQPMGITAVNGILEVNTPVNLSTPTNTILRNGIISNNRSILTQSSTGAFQITADNAVLNNMKLDLNGGGLNIQGNTISSDSVNITGTQNITVSAGKTLSVNGVFDVSDRNISGPGGMTLNGTSVYRTGNPGGFSGAGSSLTTTTSLLKPGATVELYATGNQTLNSRNDFTNIIFSGSGTKSLAGIDFAPAGTVTMMNNIVVNSGTTNMGGPSSNLTMIGGSRFIVNNSGLQPTFGGTYNIALNGAPNFIEFNGAAGQTIRGNGVTYNRLEVSGAGVSNAGQNISLGVNGIFLINNGGIYNSVNNTITGSGVGTSADHWAVAVANGGTFLVGNPGGFNGTLNTSAVDNNKIDIIGLQAGSTVNYNGTNQVITIPTTTDYSNLVLSGTGNKTAPSDSLSIKGDFTKSGSAIFINNGGKIAFNGIAGQTFYSTGTRQLVFNNFANNNTAGLTINDSMAIYKEMYLGLNSKLILKDSVTLKSDNLNTANVPPIQHDNAIAYSSKGTTSGSFIVERYMPVNKKAWHILSRPTKGSTIKASWQEGSLIPNGNP
ncbi:MAG: hypothetical protein ABI204_01310, partial [Ginsengibacter sp.]